MGMRLGRNLGVKSESWRDAGSARSHNRWGQHCGPGQMNYGFLRKSSFRLVASSSRAKLRSAGSASLYSAARTLFGKPSSAYLATAESFSAHKINPTGGFSPSLTQCSRAKLRYKCICPASAWVNLPTFKSMTTRHLSLR
jgi:hypothetical protein